VLAYNDTYAEYRRNKANDGSGRGVKRADIISNNGHDALPHGDQGCSPVEIEKIMLENARRAHNGR
jgi:hypothetical protein